MKTFTNCAEKKAKQFLNLLQGYTKGIRMTVILVLLLMGVSNAWGAVSLKYQKDMPSGNYDASTSKTMTQSSANSNRYYCEISLSANSSYGFFIINGSNYYKVDVTATSNNSVQLYDYGSSNYGNSSHRVTYKTGTAGIYIFTYDASNHKICVSPKSSETIKIAYDVAQGHDGDWNLNNYVNLTQVGSTANYTIDLDLQAKKYYMFVQISNSIYWRAGSTLNVDGSASLYYYGTTNYGNSGDKINFTPSTAGKYRFTWNHQDKTIKLEPFYSVIYKGNSHTSGSVPTTSLHLKGSTVTVASNSGNLARTGYTFGGWNTNSAGTGTNYTAGSGSFTMGSSNTTLYAKWNENTYNVVISTDGNGTTNQTGTKSIGIVGISITATPKIGSAFKQWEVTGGAKVANATSATTTITATAAGTVKAVFEEKPATTIYLEPTGHWNSHKAVFQAHVWQTEKTGVNLDMVGIGDPSHADGDNKSPYRYYKVEVPYGYDKILFFREDPANKTTIWNQTGDLTIPTDNKTLYEIKSTGDGTTTKATGTWKEANLVYTITLGYCDFGTYGFKYNGQSYFSKPNENVTLDVPAGAQIEILEGQPFSNAYTGDVIKAKPTRTTLSSGTVNGDITLDDNFVTKEPHVVYLGVPNSVNTWNSTQIQNNTRKFYVWRTETGHQYNIDATNDAGKYVFEINDIKYYQFTIAAGCNDFRFEQKDATPDNDTYSKTVWFPFQIPLTDVNCFTLDGNYTTSDGHNYYTGSWNVLPAKQRDEAKPGDHRLLYIEQKVEEENGHPNTIITKAHPSDIIRQGDTRDTYSLHIYNKVENGENGMNDPEILVQECTGYDGVNPIWTTRERHMVFGPLHAGFDKAAMPGRRNADGDPDAILRYDNGIENIKNDTHADNGSGVWNFIVTRDGSNNFTGLNLKETARYKGEYYIRTDNAEGRWDQYTLNDNYMTYSQYAKDHSGFSHYFCRWVEVKKDKNTKFVIANDYGIAISDTLAKDAYTNEHGDIAHDANIRWSWNMVNNEIARAYIQGTWDVSTSKRNRNLVVNYKSSSSAADATDLLDDSGDWIYQKDFTVKVGSHLNSLTAQYPVSTGTTQTFASNLDMLTGNPDNDNEYKVRILYDFKINKTLVALVPDNGKQADIVIDVIIERKDQGLATQVQAQVNATRTEGSTVYAVMSFTKDHIKGGASKYAKQFYWISFPFNVRVSDVFGFGEYGKHWIIQWYDGAERAKNGCWIDSPTYWRFQTDTTNYVLEAGKGYVLTLDLAEMDVFTNTNQVSLYFPSRQTVKTVDGEIIHELNTTTLAPYTCTIQRNDRYIKDSHWHMLGVPSYANKNKSFTQPNVAYFYQYNSANDTYTPTSSGSFNFNSMFSYMVQFAGTINWSEFTFIENGGQGLAAKRNTDNANDKHVLRLELQKNNASVDQTFVQLQAEEATEMFDMNLDLTKMINSGNNIYSLIPGTESNIEVAANAMPIKETIIPLGVNITAAGEYTFAMPDGTDGIVVELIDYEANTTTNLLFNDYTVSLPKGTFENRFALSVKPDKTATSLENIFNEATGDEVKKFIIDGVLYMQKDGVLYDAQGHIVR